MPSLAHPGYFAGRPISLWHKAIHHCRLADAGMPDERGQLALEQCAQLRQIIVAPGCDDPQVQAVECGPEGSAVSQIGLGEREYRLQTADVGRGEGALDKPGARRRVGQRSNDEQLVGVGDDDPP